MREIESLDYRAQTGILADVGEEFGENRRVRYCDVAIERVDGGDVYSTRR